MHSFTDLIDRSTAFTLASLSGVSEKIGDELQTSGAIRLVKALQMVQLQKVIMAVGMFSIFEASLQSALSCKEGFRKANDLLETAGKTDLKRRFTDLQIAINVLKHGHGRSYDDLIKRVADLDFRVRLPGQAFFEEGDVSEIATLVEVDDPFVTSCARVIREVSEAIRSVRPDITF